MPAVAPYGTWSSPWTLDRVAVGSSFPQFWAGQIAIDVDGQVYALIRSMAEGGRGVVLRLLGEGRTEALVAAPYNVRTTIIEYGGSGFLVHAGVIYFINADQRWHRRDRDGAVRPITAEGQVRYGAPLWDPARSRIICVREDHRGEGEPVNALVAVDPEGDTFGTVLVGGDDFYAWPALSGDGRQLAWVSWNHPHVPWDVTGLERAELDASGAIASRERVVAEREEVACDPQFSPDGALFFCSDRSEWWNYYRWESGGARAVAPLPLEFARPIWLMGTSDYRVIGEDDILGVYTESGMNRLGRVRVSSGELTPLDLPYTYFSRLEVHGDRAYALASSPSRPAVIIEVDLRSSKHRVMLEASSLSDVGGHVSTADHICFPSAQGRTGYGFLYMPRNADTEGPPGSKPPLLVFSHGGPTGCTNTCYNPGIQFWTSRGFAVFDINYAGSTGYGRRFRNLLKGGWGVVDMEDHAAAALHLAKTGVVDPQRLAVRGWSAGGFNVFASLAFSDVFHAGAAYFGISDVGLFAAETHKFEAFYADYLVGPRETSQALYKERSPFYSADTITAPLIMFQGSQDRVTPPNQSELILESLRRRGVPVAYRLFEGEGHGFRKASTNLACLESELAFYGQVFGFTPADPLPPFELENAAALPNRHENEG